MKRTIIALAIILASGISATPVYAHKETGKKSKKHATTKKYTCPMHPEVVSIKPGKCSKCGMNLELAKADKKK